MKGYADYLAAMISGSGKTLRRISEECMELGVAVDPSYISRLQSGKQAPASDEIHMALAQVCGADPGGLLLAAYSEKAPAFVQTFISEIAGYLMGLAKVTLGHNYPKPLAANMLGDLQKMNSWELISHIITDHKYIVEALSGLIDSDGDKFYFEMPDASLAEIPFGSKMIVNSVQSIEEVSEGDYVLVTLKDNTHHVRRLISHEDRKILFADNLSHKSYTLDENITVTGKVIYIQPHYFKP